MPITYVQSTSVAVAGGSTSIAGSFPGNVGTGKRLLVLAVGYSLPSGTAVIADISSVTDSLGTVFSNATFTNGGSPNNGLGIYYGLAPTVGGADTITVAFAASEVFRVLAIHEYSGNDPASPFDVAASTGTTSASPNSGVITTAIPNELIFGVVIDEQSSNTITAGANESFTKREDLFVSIQIATEDAIKAAAGSTSAQFSFLTSHFWLCAVAAFKPNTIPAASEDDPLSMLPGFMPNPSLVSVW